MGQIMPANLSSQSNALSDLKCVGKGISTHPSPQYRCKAPTPPSSCERFIQRFLSLIL
jgi:hypothetical protein